MPDIFDREDSDTEVDDSVEPAIVVPVETDDGAVMHAAECVAAELLDESGAGRTRLRGKGISSGWGGTGRVTGGLARCSKLAIVLLGRGGAAAGRGAAKRLIGP